MLVMIGAEVKSDRAGVAALVETGVFEADREGVDTAGGLDFAEGGGDARGVNTAGEKYADWVLDRPIGKLSCWSR